MEKDPLFGFRNTIIGKDSKGRDTLSLYLNQENVAEMISVLQSLESNEAGVKFVFHTGKKTNQQTGHSFDSTFGFVKAVSTKSGGAPARVTPKATANNAEYGNLNKTVA